MRLCSSVFLHLGREDTVCDNCVRQMCATVAEFCDNCVRQNVRRIGTSRRGGGGWAFAPDVSDQRGVFATVLPATHLRSGIACMIVLCFQEGFAPVSLGLFPVRRGFAPGKPGRCAKPSGLASVFLSHTPVKRKRGFASGKLRCYLASAKPF